MGKQKLNEVQEKILELHDEGMTIREIWRELKIDFGRVNNTVKNYRGYDHNAKRSVDKLIKLYRLEK